MKTKIRIITILLLCFVWTTSAVNKIQALNNIAVTNITAKAEFNLSAISSIPSSKRIRISWSPLTFLTKNYQVFRSTSPTSGFVLVKTLLGNQTVYLDTSIRTGVKYYYKVRAVLSSGSSTQYSSIASVVYVQVSKITTGTGIYSVVIGKPLKIDYILMGNAPPYSPTYSDLKFNSSNPSVCSVGSGGILTAMTMGTSTITITSIESPSVSVSILCSPKIGHETSESVMQSEILRTWGSPFKFMSNGVTPVKILSINSTSDRQFGANRDNGTRAHAGVDLYVSSGNGTPVYAMTSGKVTSCSLTGFWASTGQITVQNNDGTIVRYAEIRPESTLCKFGAIIKKGEMVGKIVQNTVNQGTMVHLMLFKGTNGSTTGAYMYVPYTPSKPYANERRDLLNPDFLKAKCSVK